MTTRAFQIGETVPFQIVVVDNDPESASFKQRIDPAAAKIQVTDPTGAIAQALTDLVNVAVGVYRFEFDTSGQPSGDFFAEFRLDRNVGGPTTIFRETVRVNP